MKIRVKSSLEVSWALLEPLGTLFVSLTCWEHLESLLRASWSVLEASRWHPRARRGPHMAQNRLKSIQNRIDFLIDF